MPQSNKRIFISYAHEDKAIADQLARALTDAGQDVWWDQWEIAAGDSLVKKIFMEGIATASAFVILLSPASVRSKWVQEELDNATVRRIEDLTRVIPIVIGDVQIPAPLRTLRWIDLRDDFSQSVRDIINAVHGVSSKPALGKMPSHLGVGVNVPGMSKLASIAAMYILENNDKDEGQERAFDGQSLSENLELEPVEVNDAVDELEDAGLVGVTRALGTHPFDFMTVEPTYLLFQLAADNLGYDPEQDIQKVLAAVASSDSVDGKALANLTQLSPGRLNRAVDHVREHGLAEVVKFLGTYPFNFGLVRATRRTRQAVASRV